MEIEVGEYVRTKDGFIDRIDSFNINTNIIANNIFLTFSFAIYITIF